MQASHPQQTLAEALLGTLAGISMQFGVHNVTLGAEDHGSGKLLRFYKNLGFSILDPTEVGVRNQPVRMEAPIEAIVALAPSDWVQGLTSRTFDSWGWLWHDIPCDGLSDYFDHLGLPQRWTWNADTPTKAPVVVRMSRAGSSSRQNKVEFHALVSSAVIIGRGWPYWSELESQSSLPNLLFAELARK